MKRTGVEKNGHENGESSISTSSSPMEMSQGQGLTTDSKIEEGNSIKKIKRDESLNSCVDVQVGPRQEEEEESSVQEASMDNLPPEMLMEILKCVDTPSLFKCRLVNRNWNNISTGILRNRSSTFMDLEYADGRFFWNKFRVLKKRTLRNFLTCIKNSKDCPYSQFSFFIRDSRDQLKFFKEKDFKEFTSYFASSNQRLKSLSLHFDFLHDNLTMFRILAWQLRDLLLNKIPRLEELALDFEISAEAPEVKLFPTPKQTKAETKSNQVPVQLPHLKVLRLDDSPMISSYTEIFKDLLNAAVNLKKLCMQINKPEDFQFLHSMGKLHLLKKAIIEMDTDFFSAAERYKKSITPLPLPKLEFLEINESMFEDEKDSIFWGKGAKFLGNLFESSKDTLKELKTHPIGFFPGLQLPTFTKLRKLELTQFYNFPQRIFPSGIRTSDVFPAVSELDLDIDLWDAAFPQEDSIPLLPNVKILIIFECNCTENSIFTLPLICPNLEKLKIQRNDSYHYDAATLNFLDVGRAIWTHLKQLESLEFDVDLDLPQNNPTALDSCFTGISLENCQRLNEMMEAQKTLEKWGSQVRIPESELKSEREHPSILDMKDLKKLTINSYSGEKLLKKTDFFTKLTWISEKFAFNFLPHLKPNPEEED